MPSSSERSVPNTNIQGFCLRFYKALVHLSMISKFRETFSNLKGAKHSGSQMMF